MQPQRVSKAKNSCIGMYLSHAKWFLPNRKCSDQWDIWAQTAHYESSLNFKGHKQFVSCGQQGKGSPVVQVVTVDMARLSV